MIPTPLSRNRSCGPHFCAIVTIAYLLINANAQGLEVISDLAWDDGSLELGAPTSYQTPEGELLTGDFLFRITTNNSSTGAWRTMLNILEGEADLYLKRGAIPNSEDNSNITKRSTRSTGDDGLVLAPNEFAPGQEWYVLVRSESARWRLFSGEVHIRNLGSLGFEDSNENGAFDNGEPIIPTLTPELTVGPEGSLFFKALVPDGAAAWALTVPTGNPYIYVKKSAVPVGNISERRQRQRLLLVPDYLQASSAGATYFIRIEGDPGDSFQLDSRLHAFTELDFHSTQTVLSTKGGYQTYRYTVPPDLLAWDISIAPTEGNPDICLRRDQIPSEVENDAFSEANDLTADGITLSPSAISSQDGLTDGVFFLTVYSDGPYIASLKSGAIAVESINFTDSKINSTPEKAGWRYYVIDDIESQTGLGWELELTDFAENTEIAIRRNAVPSRWQYRRNGSISVLRSNGNLDMSSTTGLLQNPRHQKDVWYVGVFQPDEPLGEFVIHTRPIGGEPVDFNNGDTTTEGHTKGRNIYYRIDVPADCEGWYFSIDQVVSSGEATGNAGLKVAIAKEGLPVLDRTKELEQPRSLSLNRSTWASGEYWTISKDWTNRPNDNDGSKRFSFCLAKGRPLEPGTYYIGVLPTTPVVNYRIKSRGIGEGAEWGIPIQPLSITGTGDSATTQLGLGEIQVFKTVIDETVPDWHLSLTDTEGESFLAISRDRIAGSAARDSDDPDENAGSLVKRIGDERFTFLSTSAEPSLEPGNYYVTVVGQGHIPEDWTAAALPATALLQSHGPLSAEQIGTATGNGVTIPFSVKPGEIKPLDFTLPVDALAVEASLTLSSGNATVTWWTGPNKRTPKPSSARSENYGFTGGEDGRGTRSDEIDPKFYFSSKTPPIITATGLSANDYRLTLRAESASEGGTATGTLSLKILTSTTLPFDGGEASIGAHSKDRWQYLDFDVPSDILGWDLRIDGVRGSGSDENSSVTLEAVLQRDLAPPASGANLRASSSLWPSGSKWTLGLDSTEAPENPDGSRHYAAVLPAGKPLEAGHYILGIKARGGDASYNVTSRGIGSDQSIGITSLEFGESMSAQVLDLKPREVRYFKITVPEGVPSWSITGDASLGSEDFRMALRKDGIPGTGAFKGGRSNKDHGSLIAKSEPGTVPLEQEFYAIFPQKGNAALAAGDYYLNVIGVGRPNDGHLLGTGTSTVQLSMTSPIPVTHLGTAPGSTELKAEFDLRAGSLALFDANIVESSTDEVSAILNSFSGNPGFSRYVGDSSNFPIPPRTGVTYGFEGGENKVGGAVLGICDDLEAGTNRFVVRAMKDSHGTFVPASGDLQIRYCGEVPPLRFDGGIAVNEVGRAFQFYRVDVPADALGWQLKLISFKSGFPETPIELDYVIRRDNLPESTSVNVNERNTEWPTERTYKAGDKHWTRVTRTNEGARSYCTVIPMGQPLEAGRYFIGIRTRTNTLATFVIESTGIGADYTHTVDDLAFTGAGAQVPVPLLSAQETKFYKVEIPASTRSWEFGVDVTRGDLVVAVSRGRIPGSLSATARRPETFHGWLSDKPGSERLYLLPPPESEYLPEGPYYIAVASKGSGGNSSVGGAEPAEGSLFSLGPLQVTDLGDVNAAPASFPIDIPAGHIQAVDFTLSQLTPGVEIRLDGQEGNPRFAVWTGDPLRFPAPPASDKYGVVGGETDEDHRFESNAIHTLTNVAPGTYRLVVRASKLGSAFPAGRATLSIAPKEDIPLAFGPALVNESIKTTHRQQLVQGQKAVYRVEIPSSYNDRGTLGWLISLNQFQGSDTVIKAFKQSAEGNPEVSVKDQSTLLVVPPWFTPGETWYLSIEASTITDYEVTSRPVQPEEPSWEMPNAFNETFGDSALEHGGDPLRELSQDDWHFYEVDVAQDNLGLLRTFLKAVSGNPELYIREGGIPTTDHKSASQKTGDILFNRDLTESGSSYGNWVPADGKTEDRLSPGTWFIGIKAVNRQNASYELTASSGNVQEIALDQSSTAERVMAGRDWHYYRCAIPEDGLGNWTLNFVRSQGNARLFVRDTIPPGLGKNEGQILNDYDDRKNLFTGGYEASGFDQGINTYGSPPLRPGHVYYLGIRGTTDSVYALSTSFTRVEATVETVDFTTGTYEGVIPSGEELLFKIPVPLDATRWQHVSTHDASVRVRVDQGTLAPELSGTSAKTLFSISQSRGDTTGSGNLTQKWPYLTNKDYYMRATNTSEETQPFILNMQGVVPVLDEDEDGLLDSWELEHFGNIATADTERDSDGDGWSDFAEFALGSDPSQGRVPLSYTVTLEDGHLVMTVTKPSGHDISRVRYTVEVCDDNSIWGSDGTTIEEDTRSVLVVKDNESIFNVEKRFIRLTLSPLP